MRGLISKLRKNMNVVIILDAWLGDIPYLKARSSIGALSRIRIRASRISSSRETERDGPGFC